MDEKGYYDIKDRMRDRTIAGASIGSPGNRGGAVYASDREEAAALGVPIPFRGETV